jgi:hypothetical protein
MMLRHLTNLSELLTTKAPSHQENQFRTRPSDAKRNICTVNLWRRASSSSPAVLPFLPCRRIWGAESFIHTLPRNLLYAQKMLKSRRATVRALRFFHSLPGLESVMVGVSFYALRPALYTCKRCRDWFWLPNVDSAKKKNTIRTRSQRGWSVAPPSEYPQKIESSSMLRHAGFFWTHST